jgi:NAD+ synthase (glutamine-hydrolysing)
LRIALAQLNPTVGAIDANARAVLAAWERADAAGADIVVFPELVLTGYPPGDLVLEPQVVRANRDALERLAGEGPAGTIAIVGFVDEVEETEEPGSDWDVSVPARDDLRNAAAVLSDGLIAAIYHKARLPTYGVFDEARWFTAGGEPVVVEVGEVKTGITICEDVWSDPGPVARAAEAGASVIVALNASPYHLGKSAQRVEWMRRHAVDHAAWTVYVNAVGGQDGIVFDGDSFVCDPEGEVVARGAQFAEDLVVVDLDPDAPPRDDPPRLEETAEVWEALVLGTRDYCRKNGFDSVVIGLSGGIDSSLTAAIAVDALGPESVLGVLMPSPFTADESNEDAEALARNLGFETLTIEIEPLMSAFEMSLAPIFGDRKRDVTEENIQARIRGMLLMAISNKLGPLVLATGNKSESAVGYSTLYGDMVGGFAPILDVKKQLVYALSRHRNIRGPAIPERVLERAPTAELSPGQKDQDSLPPYAVLDEIVRLYVEQAASVEQIVAAGHDEMLVRDIVRKIDAAEFKRHQAAPFVKISERSFTKERRMPITNAWRH